MSIPISKFIQSPLLPLGAILLFSTTASIFLFRSDYLYQFFIFHIYVLIFDIYFSPSDLFHSVIFSTCFFTQCFIDFRCVHVDTYRLTVNFFNGYSISFYKHLTVYLSIFSIDGCLGLFPSVFHYYNATDIFIPSSM